MAPNILDAVLDALRDGKAHIDRDPFPHVIVENILPAEVYAALERDFPSVDYVAELPDGEPLENNRTYLRTATSSLADPDLPQAWRDFIEVNTGPSVFQSFLRIWAEEVAQLHPGLEANFAKPLDAFSTGRRAAKGDCEENRQADLMLDCQFGISSPVRKVSASHGPHVAGGAKLFSAHVFFRDEEDESQGGEFELYRLKRGPFPQKRRRNVPPRFVECVKRIPYRGNAIILWPNSPEAINAVAPRTVTELPRRYLALSGECFGGARPGAFFSHFEEWDRPLGRIRSAVGL